MYKYIPLAWIQLTYNKTRFIVAIAGIAFATLLMFMQLGFQGALYKTAIDIHENFLADIILTGPRTENLYDAGLHQTFTKRYLTQALQIEGVDSVAPLYIGFGHWKNPYGDNNHQILIFGFDPDKPCFDLTEINQNRDLLKRKDIIFFDRLSKPAYGPILDKFTQGQEIVTEINNQRVKVSGLFSMGGSIFSADGIAIASDLNFSKLMNRPLSKVSSGLIKIKKGADPDKVLRLLKAKFSGGVKVLSMKSYMELEKNYWKNGSPIGSIFTIGTIMGFIVGLVIVYQVLYSEVADNLEYYATLKAIGYGSKYFFKVIIQQSIILSLLGYIPGFLFSVLLYHAVIIIVRLPTQMEFGRAVIVLCLTTLMCCIAGMIATNKLRDGDPADIF